MLSFLPFGVAVKAFAVLRLVGSVGRHLTRWTQCSQTEPKAALFALSCCARSKEDLYLNGARRVGFDLVLFLVNTKKRFTEGNSKASVC